LKSREINILTRQAGNRRTPLSSIADSKELAAKGTIEARVSLDSFSTVRALPVVLP